MEDAVTHGTAVLPQNIAEQFEIINALGMIGEFDAKTEYGRRVGFLADYLRNSGARAYVLGISGGVDSLTAGKLAQDAVEHLRADGYDCKFIAVRLPYGEQRDEDAAQASLAFIKPDEIETVNIKASVDAMALAVGDITDFNKGNIKARARMVAQYAIAGANQGLVIGTDHCAEAVMGFYTKFGDGACDIIPLTGLNKRMVRAVAASCGAPDKLVYKVPTADLESDNPGLPDEVAHGLTYDQIDDFLEGKEIAEEAHNKIVATYRKTQHKRDLPYGPVQG